MDWNRRYQLADNDIFYDETVVTDVTPNGVYPPHVEALRDSMLDFSCPVFGQHYLGDQPGNCNDDLAKASWPNELIGHSAKDVQDEVNSLVTGGYREKKWEKLFRDEFFKPLEHSSSVSRQDSRRISRCNYYYDAFEVEEDALWTQFKSTGDDYSSAHNRLKCPKPDCVFYLPMYCLDAESKLPRITDSNARQWNQAPNESLAKPFTWSTLKQLFSHGLLSTPFRVFHTSDEPPKANSLKCFPWLIVEHKKEDESLSEAVYSQAANAAARAVQLTRSAATYTTKLAHHAHIPPIPAVTTIGPNIRVWIMCFESDFETPSTGLYRKSSRCKQGYIMRAIWAGNMTKIDDIVAFRLILENTHTWTMRNFKPLLASYINQWSLVHYDAGIDAVNAALLRRQETIDRHQTVMPIIQGLLDESSGIELDKADHLKLTPVLVGLLVQQVFASECRLLTVEMSRIMTEKLGSLKLSPDTNPHEMQQTTQDRRISVSATVMTEEQTTDNDNSDDSDYKDSQAISGKNLERLDSEKKLKRSTRSNPRGPSSTPLPEAQPSSPPPSIEELAVSPNTPDGEPVKTLEITSSEISVASTPRANISPSLVSVGSVCSSITSPGSQQSSLSNNLETPVSETTKTSNLSSTEAAEKLEVQRTGLSQLQPNLFKESYPAMQTLFPSISESSRSSVVETSHEPQPFDFNRPISPTWSSGSTRPSWWPQQPAVLESRVQFSSPYPSVNPESSSTVITDSAVVPASGSKNTGATLGKVVLTSKDGRRIPVRLPPQDHGSDKEA